MRYFNNFDGKIYGIPHFNGKFVRLPESVRVKTGISSHLAGRTPGVRIRFKTNSEHIYVKIRFDRIQKDITVSAFAGLSVLLYKGTPDKAVYMGLARPENYENTEFEKVFTKENVLEDVTLYLPRGEHIEEVTVGIDDDAILDDAAPYENHKPILFYGSSITEGATASLPVLSYTALVSRWLNSDYYNLGFSGAAKGEPEMADYINTIEKSVFVMDYDHNSPTVDTLKATHEPFFLRIREHDPLLPIVLMTRPNFDYDRDASLRRDVVRETYEKALARGDKNVYFIDGETLFGNEHRQFMTIETCHPNDLGMMSMAKTVYPVLKQILK